MGVDYSAHIVIGVQAKEVCRIENTTDNVTRYDPITGKPYKTTLSTGYLVLGNLRQEILPKENEWHYPVRAALEVLAFKISLNVLASTVDDDWEDCLIGVKTHQERVGEFVYKSNGIDSRMKTVEERLSVAGVKQSCDVYSLLSVSY